MKCASLYRLILALASRAQVEVPEDEDGRIGQLMSLPHNSFHRDLVDGRFCGRLLFFAHF